MDKNKSSRLIIGFITCGELTAKYLPYFLSSLEKQSYDNYKILLIDNSLTKENKNFKYIKENYPQIKIEWPGRNLGFGRSFNKMIKTAIDLGAGYFLVISPDIIFKPDAITKLVKALERDNKLGSVCPKILQWDFKRNQKTNIIDSCGLRLRPGLRFVDTGQGEQDGGQFNEVDIIGPSGAVAMYRIAALKKIKQNSQFFDELMFMYKEDCDLAYRLFLAGFRSRCVTGAVAYHDRTIGAGGESSWQIALNRRNKSRQAKKWSFLNQQILFIKYWRLQNPRNKIAVIWYELKMLVFILLFEQYLLGQFRELWKLKKKIKIYK